MATDLCDGAFQPNCAKKTENDQSSNVCQSFKINGKDVKLLEQILRSMSLSEK